MMHSAVKHYIALPADAGDALQLQRRGYQLGFLEQAHRPAIPDAARVAACWRADAAIMLPGALDLQPWQSDIEQSHRLMAATLEAAEVSPLLEQSPYSDRLSAHFPLVASSFEEHDEQAIEKVYFDAETHNDAATDTGEDVACVAEELWCKASWLSFIEADASLRYRFSFGMECLQDVAADHERQMWAGRLCDAIFPESASITENRQIIELLRPVLGGMPAFVERIVYFNAPNGGALMHHDVERGHDGVVYAQLSGSTFWLAAGKQMLMDELITFVGDARHAQEIARLLPDADAREQLHALIADRCALSAYMDEFDHELVEAIMDRSASFIGQMIERGCGFLLHPGDVLLMPQRDPDRCVWHSVMTLGDEPGEALSFAVRKEASSHHS